MTTIVVDMSAAGGGLEGDLPGLLDITLQDGAGNKLSTRSLAIVHFGSGEPAQLYDALSGGEPLDSNIVTTDDKGTVVAFCSGVLQIRDAVTGAVLRDQVIVLPYIPPEDLPLSAAAAQALAEKADSAQLNRIAGAAGPGLRTVIFGSSTDSRCHVSLDADIVIANGVATLTTNSDHLSFGKAWVSIGRNNANNAIERFRTTAQITRTGARSFTVPAPGQADGSGETDVRFLQMPGPPSWWRSLVQSLHGALDLVANFAQGGETTTDKMAQYQLLDALEPELIVGAFGSGNDVLSGNTANSVANLQTMVRHHTSRGRWVVLCLPPAVPTLTVQQMTIGMPITEWAVAERRRNPRLLLLDEFALTVDPMTGKGRPELFAGPTDVHANRVYADIKGKAIADLLRPLMGEQLDMRAMSTFDRVSAHPSSRQIVEGFWSLDGLVNANLLHGLASGQVGPGINTLQMLGSSERNAVCSLVARDDGRGYNQRVVFSGQAGDVMRITYSGPAGAQLSGRLLAGKVYDAAASLKLTQSAPGVLAGLEHLVEGTVSGVNARLSCHVAVDPGLTDPPPHTTLKDEPALFPPFQVPNGTVTGCLFVLQMQLAATGSVTLDWGLLTLRQRPDMVT